MKQQISVFDVIGPNMIGPSSSHTAGALRIARMVSGLIEGELKEVTFILYGSFARTFHGHGTDRALLAGIMGLHPEDRRIRDSLLLADEKGIRYHFVPDTEKTDVYPNTVEIIAVDAQGQKVDAVGESIGGGNAHLTRIDGVEVDISGDLEALVITHRDEPGAVAHIAEVLYREGINIAFLNVYRERRHETAFSVVQVDGEVPKNLMLELSKVPAVQKATLIRR